MKSIIVPVDFSPESLNGLRMALLFSKQMPVNITLLYVLQKDGEPDNSKDDREIKNADDSFKKIIAEFSPDLGNKSTIGYEIAKGRVFSEVASLANKFEDVLIATSTHGASGFQEFFIGSNAFRIISTSDCPVITLRKNFCPSEIKRIVLPIDASVDTRQKVPITTDIAKLFNAEVHVVGVHTSKSKEDMQKVRFYVSQVAGYIEGKAPYEINEVSGSNIPEMVTNYANAVKADLISITTEKSPGLSLLVGNTAHQILNQAIVPVLCLSPRQMTTSGSFSSMGG